MTENKKDETPKLIGKGSFGCVYKPSIPCKESNTRITNDGKVSKIMDIKNANKEIKQTQKMYEIDPGFHYHVKMITMCKPNVSESDLQFMKIDCSVLNDLIFFQNFNQLVFEDGGKTWEDFSLDINNLDSEQIQDFLVSAYSVVRGVQDMTEKKYVHFDLKPTNVLYDKIKKRCNIIDFGASNTIDDHRQDFRNSYITKFPDYWFPTLCPEIRFLYGIDFKNLKDNMELEHKRADEIGEMSSSKGYIFYYSCLEEHEKLNLYKDIVNLFNFIKTSTYEEFVSRSMELIDSYGIACSVVWTTYAIKQLLNEKKKIISDQCRKLMAEIRKVAIETSRIDPAKRLSARAFAEKYEQCLVDNYENRDGPTLNQNDSVNAEYKKRLLEVYPADRFFSINSVNTASTSWIKESETINRYKDVLELDLVNFVARGRYKNMSTEYMKPFFEAYKEFEKLACKRKLNLRLPMMNSPLLNRLPTSQPRDCLYLDYILLLGTRYSVNIVHKTNKYFPESNEVPCIIIHVSDKKITNLFIQWKHDNISSLLFIPLFGETNTTGVKTTCDDVSLLIKSQILNFFISSDHSFSETLSFFLELLCLALTEAFVPSLLTRLIGIICTSTEPPCQDGHSETGSIEAAFTRACERLIRFFSGLSQQEKEMLLAAYGYRMKMSVMRGSIASETEEMKRFRKELCKLPDHGRTHRDHETIAQLVSLQQSDVQDHFLQKYTEISDKINYAKRGMEDNDVFFHSRNMMFNVTKASLNQLLNIIDSESSDDFIDWVDNAIATTTPLLYEEFVCHINMIGSRNNTKSCKILTQMQIDTLVYSREEHHSTIMSTEIVDYLLGDVKNTIYVIFEDKTDKALPSNINSNYNGENSRKQKYLLYGFQIRHEEQKNQAGLFSSELVVLVPPAGIFHALNPISYPFIKLLKAAVSLQKAERSESQQTQLTHVKIRNDMLFTEFYRNGNMFAYCGDCLIQVYALSNYTKVQTEGSNKLTDVKYYFFIMGIKFILLHC